MAGSGSSGGGFDSVDAWRISLLFLAFVLIEVFFDQLNDRLDQSLKHKSRRGLRHVVQQLRAEFLSLGIISFLLVVLQDVIVKICIDSDGGYDKDGKKPGSGENATESGYDGDGAHRRLLAGATEESCPEGQEPVWPLDLLHQVHILVFLVGVIHILYACVSMAICLLLMGRWERWERNASRGLKPLHKRHVRTGRWHVWVFMDAFFQQFRNSANEPMYLALRRLFIEKMVLDDDFNFHNFVVQSMEEDFAKVVRMEWLMWVLASAYILIPGSTYAMVWIGITVLLLMLFVATKLEIIAMTLASMAYGRYRRELTPAQRKRSLLNQARGLAQKLTDAGRPFLNRLSTRRLGPGGPGDAAGGRPQLRRQSGPPTLTRWSGSEFGLRRSMQPQDAAAGSGQRPVLGRQSLGSQRGPGNLPVGSPTAASQRLGMHPVMEQELAVARSGSSDPGCPGQNTGPNPEAAAQQEGENGVLDHPPVLEAASSEPVGSGRPIGEAAFRDGTGRTPLEAAAAAGWRSDSSQAAAGRQLSVTTGEDDYYESTDAEDSLPVGMVFKAPDGAKPVGTRDGASLEAAGEQGLADEEAGTRAPDADAAGDELDADTAALFWFRRPRLLLRAFQYSYFESSLSISLVVFAAWQELDKDFLPKGSWIVGLIVLLVDMGMMVHSAVYVLPLYALVSAVALHCPDRVLQYAHKHRIKPLATNALQLQRDSTGSLRRPPPPVAAAATQPLAPSWTAPAAALAASPRTTSEASTSIPDQPLLSAAEPPHSMLHLWGRLWHRRSSAAAAPPPPPDLPPFAQMEEAADVADASGLGQAQNLCSVANAPPEAASVAATMAVGGLPPSLQGPSGLPSGLTAEWDEREDTEDSMTTLLGAMLKKQLHLQQAALTQGAVLGTTSPLGNQHAAAGLHRSLELSPALPVSPPPGVPPASTILGNTGTPVPAVIPEHALPPTTAQDPALAPPVPQAEEASEGDAVSSTIQESATEGSAFSAGPEPTGAGWSLAQDTALDGHASMQDIRCLFDLAEQEDVCEEPEQGSSSANGGSS